MSIKRSGKAEQVVNQIVSTKEAAEILDVTEGRVRHFLKEKRFGHKVGGRYIIFRDEIKRFAEQDRPKGRPPEKN